MFGIKMLYEWSSVTPKPPKKIGGYRAVISCNMIHMRNTDIIITTTLVFIYIYIYKY